MGDQLFELSEDDIIEMSARSIPEETTSPDLYDVDEIISRLTREEKAICDELHELHESDDADETVKRFLIETGKIKARDGALGQTALSKLTKEYFPRITHVELAQIIPFSVTAKPVVRRKTSNRSNGMRPKIARFRNRQQPNQTFRSR